MSHIRVLIASFVRDFIKAPWRMPSPFQGDLFVDAAERFSLTDKVFQYLMGQLSSRQLKVGHRISARSVADELDVSRTTVNKAINRLEAAGYVKPDEGRH